MTEKTMNSAEFKSFVFIVRAYLEIEKGLTFDQANERIWEWVNEVKNSKGEDALIEYVDIVNEHPLILKLKTNPLLI